MEGSVNKKVLVVGATNFPERIDPAILRSGRIDKSFHSSSRYGSEIRVISSSARRTTYK